MSLETPDKLICARHYTVHYSGNRAQVPTVNSAHSSNTKSAWH